MRRAWMIVGLLSLACRRTHPTPARRDAAVDLGVADALWTDARVEASAPTVVRDAAAPPPVRAAVQGPWRASARLELSPDATLAEWDAPPDLDGDGLDDAVRAVRWDPTTARCAGSARDCPAYDDDEHEERTGVTVAVALSLSGDRAEADAGRVWRLAGVRRVGPLPAAPVRSRWTGVTFAEFGPAVMTVSTVQSDDGGVADVMDVVDLYVGVGMERHVGSVIHHCTREPGHAPVRSGSVALGMPAWAPLVWRAAMAHPFSNCEAPAEQLDQSLGAPLTQGFAVTVASRTAVEAGGRVLIAPSGDGFTAVDARAAHTTSTAWPEDLSVFAMGHGCSTDRLEYRGADRHRCRFELRRDDGPLPGCLDGSSALDPTAPLPVAVVGGGDAGPLGLVYSRGGSQWQVQIPADCRGTRHRLDVAPFRGTLAPGASVSPDGRAALFSSGLDLWLSADGRRLPVLLNPPGGALPRGTLRAVWFIDATHAAAVISRELLVFSWERTGVVNDPPEELTVSEGEIRRALRGVQ